MTRSATNANPESPSDASRRAPRLALLVLFCAIVLAFRFAAWLNPSSYVEIPDSLGPHLNALGTLFFVCAVWVWVSGPARLTRVFLAYGIGGAVHWGGTIAATNPGVEIAFAVLYMAATAMGDAAFLDLALRYPRANPRRGVRTPLLYLLAILTLCTVPIAPFLPTQVVEAGVGVVIGLAFLMAIAGGVVFIVKWVRATRDERRESFLTPIVGVLILASGIDLLADGGVLPGQPEAWTLVYGLEPLVLAWAVTHTRGSPGAR